MNIFTKLDSYIYNLEKEGISIYQPRVIPLNTKDFDEAVMNLNNPAEYLGYTLVYSPSVQSLPDAGFQGPDNDQDELIKEYDETS